MVRSVWDNVKVADDMKVVMTYAFDQAAQNPRSGKVVVHCTIYVTITGTRDGQPRSDEFVVGITAIEIHDSLFEQMKLGF